TSAIIVAAGSSRRMGFDKLTATLAGKPVIAHSMAAFEAGREIGEIIIVTREDRVEEMTALVKKGKFKKVAKIIDGGPERYLSVWEVLRAVSAKAAYVAIHDGARPLVTPEMIRKCLTRAKKTGAACLATPIPETVKRADGDGMVKE